MTYEAVEPRKQQLSQTKQALLSVWLGGEADEETVPEIAVEPDRRHEPFPLTNTQQAYWLGRNRAFSLGTAPVSYVELECEELDLTRLEHAVSGLIARHDMLRAIVQSDGTQRVLASVPLFQIESKDIRHLPPEHLDHEIGVIRGRMIRSFDRADRWPLFRIAATRIDDRRTRLHVAFDILIVDVQSVRILRRDLGVLYANPDVTLQPLSVSFRDLVLAERARKDGGIYERARAYWLGRLDTLPPPPALSLVRRPEDVGKPQFVRRADRLSAPQWTALKCRAATAKLTATAFVLAVFAEVLESYAASPHFTLNLTLYNRPDSHPQADEVVGDFTSLTLVEIDVRKDENFEDYSCRLQKQLWTDIEHRSFDGVEVMRERMRRLKTRDAMMPVVLTSNLNQGPDAAQGAPLGKVVFDMSQTPQVWIDHQVAEHDGDLVYNWDVAEDLFAAGFIDQLMLEYRQRLEALAVDEGVWSRSRQMTVRPAPSEAENPQRQCSVEDKVKECIATILGFDSVDDDANPLEIGATSIDVVRIANALEEELGVRPDIEQLFDAPTVRAVAQLYAQVVSATASPHDVRADGTREPESVPLILDPEERQSFKDREPGLRSDLDEGESIELVPPASDDRISLALGDRRSHRSFMIEPVRLEQLSVLLGAARRTLAEGQPKYAYPSAGSLYPVQIYLHAKRGRVAGVPAGTYYYNPKRHALVTLSRDAELERSIQGWINRDAFDEAAFSLFLIADELAMEPMYGNLTREFCMYEAGAISQLAMMAAATCNLGLCPIGRVDLDQHRHLLKLIPSHRVLHSLLGGVPRTQFRME